MWVLHGAFILFIYTTIHYFFQTTFWPMFAGLSPKLRIYLIESGSTGSLIYDPNFDTVWYTFLAVTILFSYVITRSIVKLIYGR